VPPPLPREALPHLPSKSSSLISFRRVSPPSSKFASTGCFFYFHGADPFLVISELWRHKPQEKGRTSHLNIARTHRLFFLMRPCPMASVFLFSFFFFFCFFFCLENSGFERREASFPLLRFAIPFFPRTTPSPFIGRCGFRRLLIVPHPPKPRYEKQRRHWSSHWLLPFPPLESSRDGAALGFPRQPVTRLSRLFLFPLRRLVPAFTFLLSFHLLVTVAFQKLSPVALASKPFFPFFSSQPGFSLIRSTFLAEFYRSSSPFFSIAFFRYERFDLPLPALRRRLFFLFNPPPPPPPPPPKNPPPQKKKPQKKPPPPSKPTTF